MTKYTLLLLLITLMLGSCRNDVYYRTKTGLLYKVVSSTATRKDSIARMGNTVKVRYIQRVGDTIIDNTYDKMPLYYMVIPGMSAYNPLEPFDYGLKEGDSVETIQIVDSMVKKGIFKKLAPWMKKGDQWITTMRVEKVFRSDSLLNADKEQEAQKVMTLQKALGTQRIESFLDKHNIKVIKTAKDSVFVQIVQNGNGPLADTGKYVSINYNVKTLKGKTLNSTTDTSFHQKGPVSFVLGAHFMPPMVEERLRHLPKGSDVKLYIPGVLIFGVSPQSQDVKPGDDIVFEVQLVDVQDKAPVAVATNTSRNTPKK